ncbi:MAG: hypothetical protein VB013_00435 [Anaerolineaceae bacterium]|nr:hypothetical protein [Anaerolineaceae bacterium]
MPIEGYVEYPKREYCRAAQCPVQSLLDLETPNSERYEKLRVVCQTGCLQTSHSFHKWLNEQGYVIVKPAK